MGFWQGAYVIKALLLGKGGVTDVVALVEKEGGHKQGDSVEYPNEAERDEEGNLVPTHGSNFAEQVEKYFLPFFLIPFAYPLRIGDHRFRQPFPVAIHIKINIKTVIILTDGMTNIKLIKKSNRIVDFIVLHYIFLGLVDGAIEFLDDFWGSFTVGLGQEVVQNHSYSCQDSEKQHYFEPALKAAVDDLGRNHCS